MRTSSQARPNGILDLGIGDGPVLTDVYASEEDQAEAQREMDEQQPHGEPVTVHNDASARAVHVHIHRRPS